MQGWIKLHRKITNHWLYKKKPFSKFQAFIDILITANHTDKPVNIGNEIIICKRGECLLSLDSWAEKWGWSKSAVRRYVTLLKKDSIIDTLPCSKTTHLKVLHYETYQDVRIADETQVKRKRNASETHLAPTKEGEEGKKVRKKHTVFIPPTVDEVREYAAGKTLNVDADAFVDAYAAKGWMVGKNKMKDWQAAVRNAHRGAWYPRKDYDPSKEFDPQKYGSTTAEIEEAFGMETAENANE